MKPRKLILLYFVASLTLGGCAARQKNVTNLPAGVTLQQVQNWDSAVANLDKIAQTNSSVRQAVVQLFQSGAFSDTAAYGKILMSLGKIDELQIDAVEFLKAQPKNWSVSTQQRVQNDVTLIQQELQNITQQQLVGIKSGTAQQQVQQLIGNIGSLATLILSTVG